MGVNLSHPGIGSYLELGGGTLTGNLTIGDDLLLRLGTSLDSVFTHNSAGVAANTTLANVLVGTVVSQAIAANSFMLSNITASGDIAFYANNGGNSTQFFFYDTSAGILYLRPSGSNAITGTINLTSGNIGFQSSNQGILATATDNSLQWFYARDNGVGNVEVGRWASAADPYFQFGRDDTGVATNAITDMVVWQAGAGSNNESAGFGFGLSVKLGNAASEVEERASLDFRIVTATNGAETAALDINLMAAGAMSAMATISPTVGLTFKTSIVSAAVADEVTLGGYEIGVGQRALAWSQEYDAVVSAGTASTHKIPVEFNGGVMYLLASNV